jgi:hypothetical protein
MRKAPISILVLAVIVLSTNFALADDGENESPPPVLHGLQLGAYSGYVVPGGGTGSTVTPYLGDLVGWMVPIGLQAGWRFDRDVYVGGAASWGPAGKSDKNTTCSQNVSCSQQVIQIVGEIRLYFERKEKSDPTPGAWVSFGAGWEVFMMTISGDGASGTTILNGLVPFWFQIGFDLRSGALELGPFVGLSVGWYQYRTINPAPPGIDSAPVTLSAHDWFGIGFRGSYGPRPEPRPAARVNRGD